MSPSWACIHTPSPCSAHSSSRLRKGAQVILATQSPLLLDHFEPEDVLVTERVNGRSEFNRLDRAELEEWLKDYSLGQLWEKNEIGGRPSLERLQRLPLQCES